MSKLISVHVAKAGGTSLLKSLREAYGDRFLAHYDDNPADPRSERWLAPHRHFSGTRTIANGIECVHGHFHPALWKADCSAIYSTILRDPVQNVISIYFFWKEAAAPYDTLHDYVLKNGLSLLEVASLPIIRGLLHRTYFDSFDMRRFALIGNHDDRAGFFARLSRITGRTLEADVHENITRPSEERSAFESDWKAMRALRDILRQDVKFFERWAP